MPELPKRLSVFLCHASGDKPQVRELYQRLLGEGWIDPWLDEEKLYPGQDWDIEIEKAVEAAHAVIVCLSTKSVNKEGYVQRELRFVLDIALTKPEETIFVIPLRLEACEPPRRLRAYQFADYFPEEGRERAYQRLLHSLKLRARSLGLQTETEEPAPAVTKRRTVARKASPHGTPQAGPAASKSPARLLPEYQTWGGIEFARIPAGKFLMGSTKENELAFADERPQHEVELPHDYWLARFPVTNAHYNAYVLAKDGKHPTVDWQKKADYPVVYVSWQNAMDYCRWLDGLLRGELPPQHVLRLPTEAEWEKAARGPQGLEWPWGNTFDQRRCNLGAGGSGVLTPVGRFSPRGDAQYGCADMAGNVWEWTHSLYRPYPYTPFKAGDRRESELAPGDRVLRGGSVNGSDRAARCACRNHSLGAFSDRGFRVAVSPVPLG